MAVMGIVNDGVRKGMGVAGSRLEQSGGRGFVVEEGASRLVTGYNSAASGCALCLTHNPRGHWGHSSSTGPTDCK